MGYLWFRCINFGPVDCLSKHGAFITHNATQHLSALNATLMYLKVATFANCQMYHHIYS